jgi:hypothetical protein
MYQLRLHEAEHTHACERHRSAPLTISSKPPSGDASRDSRPTIGREPWIFLAMRLMESPMDSLGGGGMRGGVGGQWIRGAVAAAHDERSSESVPLHAQCDGWSHLSATGSSEETLTWRPLPEH